MSDSKKHKYLVCYDYGQGGVWCFIDALSPEQVEGTYPDLKVVPNRPQWLNDDLMSRLEHYDIDAPGGWLLKLQEAHS